MSTTVSFGHFDDAWSSHAATLKALIEQNGIHQVCEVGGGANPLLPKAYLLSKGLDYTILDVSQEELDKAPAGYNKVLADICAPSTLDLGPFDLVFTKMLAEHVSDGGTFHRNVRRMLVPGGLAFHFFPTLFALPFIANWLLPTSLSERLLQALAPRNLVKHGKFPGRYSWCRGPTPRQVSRIERLGFEIVEYRGFFGHGYYNNIPILRALSRVMTRLLLHHPMPALTTFAYLIVRRTERPQNSADSQ